MRVLAVIAHPDAHSFTRALAAEFIAGAESVGHKVDIADLYAEAFDPVLPPGEAAEPKNPPPEVAAYQARLHEADVLALAYPVWWAAPPAILQGWLQRVLTRGFAFDYGPAGRVGLLSHRAQLLINIGTRDESQFNQYVRPMVGVLEYCGMTVATCASFGVYSGGDPARRQRALAAARAAGRVL